MLEAAAAGLPVIAHPVGAVPEMVLDGGTGLLRRDRGRRGAAGRPAGPAATTQTAVATMGRAGREHVEQHYDMRTAADRLAALLVAAAGRGKQRAA